MKKEKCLNINAEELFIKVILCDPIKEIIKATNSEVVFEADEVSIQIKILYEGNVWLRYKLRDRRFDGAGWKPSKLTDWAYGGDNDKFNLGSAVEESIYCLDPRYPLSNEFTKEQTEFITNPFEALPFSNPNKGNLEGWLKRWKEIFALKSIPFPGYFTLKNIPGARSIIHKNATRFLKDKGYEYLTAVPTWWHTAYICEHLGFRYQCNEDERKIKELTDLLQSRFSIPRNKLSWIAMLQFWAQLAEGANFVPEEFLIDKSFILRDSSNRLVLFPLSPERNLWQIYKV